MPQLFKRTTQMLLMLRQSHGDQLATTPEGIKLRILTWLASMSTQPPFLRSEWPTARCAVQNQMQVSDKCTLSAAVQALAKDSEEVRKLMQVPDRCTLSVAAQALADDPSITGMFVTAAELGVVLINRT